MNKENEYIDNAYNTNAINIIDATDIINNTLRRDVLIVPHCILNPLTRVKGLESNNETAQKLLQTSKNIIQLPCPELLYFGARRWEMTQDQLEIPNYRRFCRRLARPYADTITILNKQAHKIHLAGISKSPSCAVSVTTIGYRGGLIKNTSQKHKHVVEYGIFTQELLKLLEKMEIEIECEDVSI